MAFTPTLGKKVEAPTSTTTSSFVPTLGKKIEDERSVSSPKDEGIFSRLARYSKKGLQTAADIFVSPVAREVERPFVSLYRGVTGTSGPVNTPFGDVKPYAEVSPGEAALGAFDLATTALPVEKLLSPVFKPVTKLISKLGPAKAKMVATGAETLANISPEKTKTLREMPELVRAAQETLQGGEAALPAIGEEVFRAAETSYKGAQKAWSVAEKNLLDTFGDKLDDAAKSVRSRVAGVFGEEGIKLTDRGVDLTGTGLSRNSTAQRVLDDIVSIISEPTTGSASFLNKRVAITNIMEEIPLEAKSVRRMASKVVSKFDEVADEVTEGGAQALRGEYARIAEPTKKILKGLTDTDGRFSMDKARLFVNRAMSDVRFDDTALLGRLDEVAGTGFAKQVKALGAAKAIDRLDPVTSGRVLDVLKTFVIAKLPLASAIVSPKVWGEAILRGAEKAAKIPGVEKTKDIMTQLIKQNVLLRLGEAPFRGEEQK